MKQFLSILFISLFPLSNFALSVGDSLNYQDDPTINQVDANGMRQGKWIFYGHDQPQRGYPMDGKISEGPFVDSRKQGLWTMYFKDGKTPRTVGNFVNNRPNGAFVKYFKNGQIKEQGTFTSLHYVDSLKRYNKDGVLIYESNYNEKGQENGKVVYYYDNGKVQFEYDSKNGKPTGSAVRYWPNGDVKERITYGDDGTVAKTSGEIARVHPKVDAPKTTNDKVKKAPVPTNVSKKFKRNGYNKVYNKNKELWMEGDFKDGLLNDGRVYIYDNDGLLLKVEVYKGGKYYSDGQL